MLLLHFHNQNFITLSAVLIAVFAFSTNVIAGARYQAHDSNPNLPTRNFQPSTTANTDGNAYPFLSWLRSSVIQTVFGQPPREEREKYPQLSSSSYERYQDEVVIRLNVTTSEEEAALAYAVDHLIKDVWAFTPDFVDIRVLQKDLSAFLSFLPSSVQSTVLIPDLAVAARRTFPSKDALDIVLRETVLAEQVDANKMDGVSDIFFQNYQPLPVIERYMRLLESMFSSIANLTTIGTSYEGKKILGLRVGERGPNTPSTGPRKTILVTGGLHGREWISTSTVSYLMWSILTTHGKEPMITKLLQHFDIVFVPVLNPDGYEYSWNTDRLWRKSRQRTKMSYCPGFDLDHAFGYEWQPSTEDLDPCSESYGGDKPFQAIEAVQLANWAKAEVKHSNVKFVGFLDLHSYSQQVLFPYSYSCAVDPPNRENLEELAVGLAKAIRLSSGESYGVASACEGAIAQTSDEASGSHPRVEAGGGSAIDWFYHELHARYSYQVKLRDTGSYGFLLPKENIIPAGEEMLNALKYFGDFLLGNNGIEKPAFQNDELEGQEWVDLKRRARRR